MAKTTKVLILGGTGIIGRDLSAVLLDKGYDIYVVSRRGGKGSSPNLHYVTANARDADELRNKLAPYSFDTVVDLLSFDADQMMAMVDIIKDKCLQYIFVSSSTVYQGNDDQALLTETAPHIASGWSYPVQKSKAESALKTVCLERGINYTIVRPYITYSEQRISFGEWEGFSVVDAIRDERPIILGNELAESVTTLTHSHDLAVGIAGLIMNNAAMNEDFHITSNESMTWREVFEVAAQILGKKLNIVDMPIEQIKLNFPELTGKIEDRCRGREFDNNKLLKAIPGYKAKHSVQSGYEQLINHYTSSGTYKPINIMQQGRIDRLILKSGRSYDRTSDRRKIKRYRQALLKQSPSHYLRYAIGRSGLLFGAARLAVQTAKKVKGVKSDYA